MLLFTLIGVLLHRDIKIVTASAQKHGGRFESHSIACMLFMATLTSHSVTLFDEGEHGTS